MSEPYLASFMLRLPLSSHHNRTTDAAMITPAPVPDPINSELERLAVMDDVANEVNYKEIDTLNMFHQPPPSVLPYHPFTEFSGDYHSWATCLTQGINYGPTTSNHGGQTDASPMIQSEEAFHPVSNHCDDDYGNYVYQSEEYQDPNSSPLSDGSQLSPSYSVGSQNSSFSEAAENEYFPSQKSEFDADYPYFDGSLQNPTMVMSPSSYHAHHLQVANDPTGTSASSDEELSMMPSPPREGYVYIAHALRQVQLQEQVQVPVPSLFPNPLKRARDDGVNGTKVSKSNRPSKKAKVVRFPTVDGFVYDPCHEYDPCVTPTSAAMALLMSCLKPTKKEQTMKLKESKRKQWQRSSVGSPHESYVDRILASETLVTMLFKSKKGPIVCNHCHLHFENYLALAGHFDEYNVARSARCDHEDCLSSVLGFASPSEKSRHAKTQHGENSHTCTVRGCNYHSARRDCLKRHCIAVHKIEINSLNISRGLKPLKDLPSKFQDVKKSKTLTDAEIREMVAPVLAKFRELI